MNYEGIFIGGEGGGNQPIEEGTMIFKNEWERNISYNKDEVIVYFERLYIALRSNINKEPDLYVGEDWELLAYWSNNSSVSNYRGAFIQGLLLKQYDSVFDSITGNTYINYSPTNYECTTQSNLIIDLHKINNPNSLLPSMFSQPYMYASAGNSTEFDGGITYDGTVPGSPTFLDIFPLLTDFRTNGWRRNPAPGFELDPTSIYAKEGLYKFTATINYWICNVPPITPNISSRGLGEFKIQHIDVFNIDRSGLNTPLLQPALTGNFNLNQITLSGTYDVRFGQSFGVRLRNIVFNGFRWGFAIRFGIDFMGSTDPVNLRNNYVALSRSPVETPGQPNSEIRIISTLPVQEEYVIPYPIINNLLAESINMSLVDTPPNEFTSSIAYTPKCLKLNGFAQNTKYTLTCSARVGLDSKDDEILEIRACFQSSPNNIDWVDISDRQIIFTNEQQYTGQFAVLNIPLYIQYEGYIPDVQFKEQYIRVALIVIPKPNLTSIIRIIIKANGGSNPVRTFNPYNCFIQMYPDNTTLTDVVWRQTFENNGTKYVYSLETFGNNSAGSYLLPTVFCFLPVVCNNFTYPNNICKSINNQPLIYSVPNFLRNIYGPSWCGVVVRSSGSYTMSYYLAGKITAFTGGQYFVNFCRNNPCQILYTQRITIGLAGDFGEIVTTTLQLINDGDFLYPILTWTQLSDELSKIEFENQTQLTIVKLP